MAAYAFGKTVPYGFDDAVTRITAALAEQGFGILTEIDVRATMKKKLDLDIAPYKILGACNPPFAHKVLTINDKVGVLLPCNVCLQELEDRIVVGKLVERERSEFTANLKALNDEMAAELRSKLAPAAGAAR